MNKIAIITDRDSSLPDDLALHHAIYQVPINLHIDGKTYESGVDLNDKLLFAKLENYNKKYPTTSAPPPSAFIKAFESAIQAGAETIICICVSGKVSSSHNSAVLATEMFKNDITVYDSQNLSMGQGFMVLAAAEAVQNGASKEEVLQLLDATGKRLFTFAVLPTLKYIALSGRLNKFAAGLADTLNIKPILTVQDGELVVMSRQRTMNRAVEKIIEMLSLCCAEKGIERGAIIHVNDVEGARWLHEKVRETTLHKNPFIFSEFTPGLSLHTGPGTLGITIMTN